MKNRKELILKEIVDGYIETGEPVSSKLILDEYDLDYSSATVRNDMHELEEEGYLKKPYTSGGRVPTIEGFRYFVSWLLELSELSGEEQRAIVEAYEFEQQNTERLLRNTATLLANITGYAGFVLGPELEERKVEYFTMTQLDRTHLMAILVTDIGLVENRVIESEREITEEELEKIVPLLSDRLEGLRLEELKDLKDLNLNEEGWYDKMTRDSFMLIRNFLKERTERRLYLEGTLNVIGSNSEDSQDTDKLKRVFDYLEEDKLAKITETCKDKDNQINALVGIKDHTELLPYSLIVKRLANCSSSLGILGPVKMDYSKAFSTVQYMGSRLDTLLTAGSNN
ncbi:heat-inducible transcription repressor HrcA [Candidatus Bipolaricaulota bacterium]|nr:heat-inducible transcription repressor HrcA [Candidatus Bipolaricaulota bacterium]